MSQTPDPKQLATEVRHSMAAVMAIVVYMALYATHTPLFVYLPVERSFAATAPEGVIAMGLFGYMAGGLLGYAVGLLVGRWSWLHAPRRVRALRIALLVATLGALAWFAVAELSHASGAS